MKTQSQLNTQMFHSHKKFSNLLQSTKFTYIPKLSQIYQKSSFTPSTQLHFHLSLSLQQIRKQKLLIQKKMNQQELINTTVSEEQLLRYEIMKEEKNKNKIICKMMKMCKDIMQVLEKEILKGYSNNNLDNKQNQNKIDMFDYQLNVFTKLIKNIQQFNQFFYQSLIQPYQENANQNNQTIRKQNQLFLVKFYKTIIQKIIQKNQQKDKLGRQLSVIFDKYSLPLKRSSKVHKPSIMDPNSDQRMQQKDKSLLIKTLHRQSCQYALINFINTLKPDFMKQKYSSLFFYFFYLKLAQSIEYLFISANSSSHNLQQPNWMFQYIQQSFNMNYIFLKQFILLQLDQSKYQQNKGNILIYILQFSVENLFYQNIKRRLENDIKYVGQNDIEVKETYMCFRFIDMLRDLQEKLSVCFSQEVVLLENLLVEFQINRKYQILEKNFDYQHKWIEQKIFQDFYDINYSNINIKNIQAYNIISNFNILFQRLYNKFTSIYHIQLSSKITKFYQSCISNLIGHLKTSLQRIFYHSGCDKLQIVLAFKRVDNQFRSGLNTFISKDLEYQKYVKEQYYDYLIGLFNLFAVEELGKYHRKMLKITTECERYFQAVEISKEDNQNVLAKVMDLFKKWEKKLIELNSVYPYKDNKIKNMFYSFLDSTQFTSNGLVLFLDFFKLYLALYYSLDAFNMLKMVIMMQKRQQKGYLESNRNVFGFLLDSEIQIIKRFKFRE